MTDDIEVYCNNTATFQVSDVQVLSPQEELGVGFFEEAILRALRDRLMADLTTCMSRTCEALKAAALRALQVRDMMSSTCFSCLYVHLVLHH